MNKAPLQETLLARAVLCRGLKLGFQQPSRGLVDAFSADDGRDTLHRAAAALDYGSGTLTRSLSEVFAAWPGDPAELEVEFGRLFGHTLSGVVCPYEAEHGLRAALQQSQHLADLGGFYHAFGLRLGSGPRERPDHVACELEFLEFLSRKEAWALDEEEVEIGEVTRDATRSFLRLHLGRFGRSFAHKLREATADGFHHRLAGVFEVFLETECGRLGVPLGLAVLELLAWEPDDTPTACGTAGSDGIGVGEGVVNIGDLQASSG